MMMTMQWAALQRTMWTQRPRQNTAYIHRVSKKYATTSSTWTWTIIFRLQYFLINLLLRLYVVLSGVYSDATQLNWTQLNSTELNSTDPVEQRTAKSVVFLFMTSRPTNWVNCCSRCRIEFSWVELCRYKYPFTRIAMYLHFSLQRQKTTVAFPIGTMIIHPSPWLSVKVCQHT